MNGSFRIYVFAGALRAKDRPDAALTDFAHASLRPSSYLGAHLRRDIATVDYHERHNPHSHFFSFCTIVAEARTAVEVDTVVPTLLARYRDHVYADDVWDVRVPRAALCAVISASSSEATRHHSEAASQCATEPPNVPRVRIGM